MHRLENYKRRCGGVVAYQHLRWVRPEVAVSCGRTERGCVEDQPQQRGNEWCMGNIHASLLQKCCGGSRTTQPRSVKFVTTTSSHMGVIKDG